MKKHIPFSRHQSYTAPYPLFEAASGAEAGAIASGKEAFEAQFPGTLLFPDPFLPPHRLPPAAPLAALRLVAPSDPLHRRAAEAIAAAVKARWNLDLPILSPEDAEAALSAETPLLLVGGADRNARTLEIARRYQVGIFDALSPGAGGWGVTTYLELEDGLSARWVVALDQSTVSAAVEGVLSGMIETAGGEPRLRWVHTVHPGEGVRNVTGEHFRTWLATRRSIVPEFTEWVRAENPVPYRERFLTFFRKDFSGGLPYNAVFIDAGVDALRYYQFTGNREGLELFREMMWGFWGYLNDENPQVYISDLDFRVGLLCNLWNWIQPSPDITDEEREVFPRLLLGAVRLVHHYYLQNWKGKTGAHNHVTFKARSLILGWRYFRRWNLPDLSEWKKEADAAFEGVNPNAFKHRENAAHYETLVPEHFLTWVEVTGRSLPDAAQAALMEFAKREWSLLDADFHPVDYGDSDPRPERHRPFPVGVWLNEEKPEAAALCRMERRSSAIFPFEFPAAIRSFPGIFGSEPGALEGPTGWWRTALDPSFHRLHPLSGPSSEWFDKLAFRPKWETGTLYLALEGIGNDAVSHAHNEVNAVLRMNVGGRLWLMSNGYGKGADLSDASRAFRERQRGPDDHNLLVIRDAEGTPVRPPVNALLRDLGSAPLPFAVTRLDAYGGYRWDRHTLLLPDRGVIFIDTVTPVSPEASGTVELQWNLLGARSVSSGSATEWEQKGVTLHVETFGTSRPVWEESRITAWRQLIEKRVYPWTDAMPGHAILHAPETAFTDGKPHDFVNGFWLKGAVETARWNAGTRTLSVRFPEAVFPESAPETRPWGKCHASGTELEVTLT